MFNAISVFTSVLHNIIYVMQLYHEERSWTVYVNQQPEETAEVETKRLNKHKKSCVSARTDMSGSKIYKG